MKEKMFVSLGWHQLTNKEIEEAFSRHYQDIKSIHIQEEIHSNFFEERTLFVYYTKIESEGEEI